MPSKKLSNKNLYPTKYTSNPKLITLAQLEVSLHHLENLKIINHDHHNIIKSLKKKLAAMNLIEEIFL